MRFVPGLMHASHILWIELTVYSRPNHYKDPGFSYSTWASYFQHIQMLASDLKTSDRAGFVLRTASPPHQANIIKVLHMK
jgi:hypothetical protein